MNQSTLFFFTIALLLFSNYNAVAAGKENIAACYHKAQSQIELSACGGLEHQAADEELKRVYKKIQEIYSGDSLFLEKLQRSQDAWVKFQDAQSAMKWPHADNDPMYYGSVFTMCANSYHAELILERVLQLKVWLKGIEEGDVCSGSVKRLEQLQEVGHPVR